MEVKFGVDETAAADLAAELEQEPQERETANLPTRVPSSVIPSGPTGMMLGDKLPSFDDIILPRINIVQGIGKLKDSFPVGSLVLGQQTILFCQALKVPPTPATPPALLTVLGFRPTRFAEKVVGGFGGQILHSEDEVRAAGGTLDYKEFELKKASGIKRFEPLADAVIAVERPASAANDDTVFVYDVDGKKYALALWGMKGTAYTAAAKRVFFTARAIGCLRGGYPTYGYSVTTRLETYLGGNQAWIPVCVPRAKSTPAFLGFVGEILTGTPAPASVAEQEAPAPAPASEAAPSASKPAPKGKKAK